MTRRPPDDPSSPDRISGSAGDDPPAPRRPRVIRLERREDIPLLPTGPERFEATTYADAPRTRIGRTLDALKERVIGTPLKSANEVGERLSKRTGLAVFASDAMSSSAYATEEILLVLVLAGSGHLSLSIPIALAVGLLLVIVVTSYTQTIRAYPEGGGAYSVAHENLGNLAGLVAGAALLTDYILTVAVSISAGVLAIVSALPDLAPARIELALGAVLFITVINLRGLRESGAVFAIPAYAFLFAFGSMLVVGLVRLALGDTPGSITESSPPREAVEASHALTVLLVLRAFSSGAVALTGVEAIANGVKAFRPPEAHNAAITMRWMAIVLGSFLLGASFLATRYGIIPEENNSVVAQIGRIAFGGENPAFYGLQAVTALILILAANTAFADFPRLASLLSRDRYLPKQFAFRGDRLAFSWGIITLGLLAGTLLLIFQADTHALIPLYAVGVFISFTLSQSGMVVHWWRRREDGWRHSWPINAIGAITTGVVAVIVLVTKFVDGAWIITIVVPLLILMLWFIRRDYARHERAVGVAHQRAVRPELAPPDRPVIVAVGDFTPAVELAVNFARTLSTNVQGIHVSYEIGEVPRELSEAWDIAYPDVPLILVESPFRSFVGPFMAYLDMVDRRSSSPLTVIVPYVELPHWWQRLLHNSTGDRLRKELRKRRDTIIIDVPQHDG